MEVEQNFLELLNIPIAQKPEEYFQRANLRAIFQNHISRSRATGKDGVRVSSFEQQLEEYLLVIERKIANTTFKFTPFKERLILKGAGKPPRQICIPTVRDRLVLRAICDVLHTTVPICVGSSPHSVVDEVANKLRSVEKERSFIRIDVKDFFPSIKHDALEKELAKFGIDPLTRSLCMRAVSTKIGDAEKKSESGVPQGLSVSGALACLYMLRFDQRQSRKFSNYFRYVDDILILSDKESAKDVLKSISISLSRMGLIIHPLGTSGKTEITDTENGIDYLGYRINREKISVRGSSFRRMFKNISKVVTDYRYRGSIERFIFRLNLKITGCIIDNKRRGWMMFFARTEDMQQLSHLDYFVKKQVMNSGLPAEHLCRVKKFIKSYHEIRYRLNETSYIPNFDEYTIEQKTEVVSILSGRPLEEVDAFDVEMLEQQFGRLLGKEVRELEQDVGNPS